MDRDKKLILPKHVFDLYSQLHIEKPIPSIWDFGFVDELILESTDKKPYFEIITEYNNQKEIYFHTPEYDIYLIQSIDSFELFFLYNSQKKDSVLIAANKFKKYKIKFED